MIPLIMRDFIAQFVAIIGTSRKMFREQITGAFNGFDDSAREIGLSKILRHDFRQLGPEALAAFLMNCFVADHRKTLRSRRDVNQNAVAFSRFGHTQSRELGLGRGHGISHFFAADKYSDFPGCAQFRSADC